MHSKQRLLISLDGLLYERIVHTSNNGKARVELGAFKESSAMSNTDSYSEYENAQMQQNPLEQVTTGPCVFCKKGNDGIHFGCYAKEMTEQESLAQDSENFVRDLIVVCKKYNGSIKSMGEDGVRFTIGENKTFMPCEHIQEVNYTGVYVYVFNGTTAITEKLSWK